MRLDSTSVGSGREKNRSSILDDCQPNLYYCKQCNVGGFDHLWEGIIYIEEHALRTANWRVESQLRPHGRGTYHNQSPVQQYNPRLVRFAGLDVQGSEVDQEHANSWRHGEPFNWRVDDNESTC